MPLLGNRLLLSLYLGKEELFLEESFGNEKDGFFYIVSWSDEPDWEREIRKKKKTRYPRPRRQEDPLYQEFLKRKEQSLIKERQLMDSKEFAEFLEEKSKAVSEKNNQKKGWPGELRKLKKSRDKWKRMKAALDEEAKSEPKRKTTKNVALIEKLVSLPSSEDSRLLLASAKNDEMTKAEFLREKDKILDYHFEKRQAENKIKLQHCTEDVEVGPLNEPGIGGVVVDLSLGARMMCRCGQSAFYPFCDMTHVKINEEYGTNFSPFTVDYAVVGSDKVIICGCGESKKTIAGGLRVCDDETCQKLEVQKDLRDLEARYAGKVSFSDGGEGERRNVRKVQQQQVQQQLVLSPSQELSKDRKRKNLETKIELYVENHGVWMKTLDIIPEVTIENAYNLLDEVKKENLEILSENASLKKELDEAMLQVDLQPLDGWKPTLSKKVLSEMDQDLTAKANERLLKVKSKTMPMKRASLSALQLSEQEFVSNCSAFKTFYNDSCQVIQTHLDRRRDGSVTPGSATKMWVKEAKDLHSEMNLLYDKVESSGKKQEKFRKDVGSEMKNINGLREDLLEKIKNVENEIIDQVQRETSKLLQDSDSEEAVVNVGEDTKKEKTEEELKKEQEDREKREKEVQAELEQTPEYIKLKLAGEERELRRSQRQSRRLQWREEEEKEEKSKIEKEDKDKKEKERIEREEKEKMENEARENEAIENEAREREERERIEREEKERIEREEKERIEREEKERIEREERERIEREEQERIERERIAREERERIERERIEREERERIERERIEREERERIERDRIEREANEKLERERVEREENLRVAREMEHNARLEREAALKEAEENARKAHEEKEKLIQEEKARIEQEELEIKAMRERSEQDDREKGRLLEAQRRLEREKAMEEARQLAREAAEKRIKEIEEREARLQKEQEEKDRREREERHAVEKLQREEKEREEQREREKRENERKAVELRIQEAERRKLEKEKESERRRLEKEQDKEKTESQKILEGERSTLKRDQAEKLKGDSKKDLTSSADKKRFAGLSSRNRADSQQIPRDALAGVLAGGPNESFTGAFKEFVGAPASGLSWQQQSDRGVPHCIRLLDVAKTRGEELAYKYKSGEQWIGVSWSAYSRSVQRAALALISLGVKRGERVMVLCETRPEWAIVSLATQLVGGVTVTAFCTASSEQLSSIIQEQLPMIFVTDDVGHWLKLKSTGSRFSHVKHIVTMNGTDEDDRRVGSWDAFLDFGKDVKTSRLDGRISQVDASDISLISYTERKLRGIVLTHDNEMFGGDSLTKVANITGADRVLSFMPFAIAMERNLTLYAAINTGCLIYYAESLAKLHDNMGAVQPTLVFSAPVLWERYAAAIRPKLGSTDPSKLPSSVRRKLQKFIGCSRLRLGICSTACIHDTTLSFFQALEVNVVSVYSKTSLSGICTFAQKPGSGVGHPVPDVLVKVDNSTGELLVSGRNVCHSFYGSSPFARNAWLPTSDVLSIENDTYLSFKGRLDATVVNAQGKKIFLERVELSLSNNPYISNVVAFLRDDKESLGAIIAVDRNAITELAQQNAMSVADYAASPDFHSIIDKHIGNVNVLLDAASQIRSFNIIPRELSIKEGECTPTMQIDRKVCSKKFRKLMK